MESLKLFSMIIILSQTLIAVLISWFVLDCRYGPQDSELHEVTLMKILYLYDPEACKKLYFYNITIQVSPYKIYTNVVWPTKNITAANFRSKIKIWLAFHIIWAILAVSNVFHGRRPCSFYAILLPLTLVGLAMLVLDVVNACMFLYEARYTKTEPAILWYLTERGLLLTMGKDPIPVEFQSDEDTSWVPVVLAYVSMRGIVQWVINFWMVKDNYFAGLATYKAIHDDPVRRKSSYWNA